MGVNIGNSTYELNTVLSRDTQSMLERVVGQEGDEFQAVYNQSIGWAERQYASAQLMGSHFINEDGSIFGEWQTASQAICTLLTEETSRLRYPVTRPTQRI